jgi:opacity protein-like surface antigen
MKNNLLILTMLFCISMQTYSQVYSNKVVGKKQQTIKDSLKVGDYPYLLPIWGEKVAQKGYELPYSAGVSVNYFMQESSIIIDNLDVGFNNGPQYNLDQIVRFKNTTATANSISIRPDIWLLPFLNVYGILGKTNTSTEINAGLWVPDADNNWSEVFNFGSKAKFNGTTFGLGFTPTVGIGGGWLALDMNVAWTDLEGLEKPAMTFVFGPRMGKSFKLNKPDSNIAIWAGAFRVHLKSDTNGSIPLSDLLTGGDAQAKVDLGLVKVAEKQTEVDVWWNGLSNAQQANPINQSKYNLANKALETAGNFLTAIDGALSTASSSTVQYSLDKAPADAWNFLLGAQYQYNKHIMLRAEYGFLGSRKQFLTSLQYRFGL